MARGGILRWRPELLRSWTGGRGQVLLAAKTGVAAGLAWAAALPVSPTHRPYFAPIAAVVVVQPTVYDSVARAAQRVGGVVVGVLAALALEHFLPLDAWTIGLVTLVGLLIGWVLPLGPQGAVQVPVSALLVLLIGSATPGYGSSRLYDTLIGATIGAGVALLSPPASAASAATSLASERIREAADLMHRIGAELPLPWSHAAAVAWENRSSELVEKAKGARLRLEEARHSTRWNALAGRVRSVLDHAEEDMVSAERIAAQVRAIARALVDGSEQARPMPILGGLLTDCAGAVHAMASWSASRDPERRRSLDEALRSSDSALGVFLERAQQRWGNDPRRWLTFGLVLAATQRILAEVGRPLERPPEVTSFGVS